MGQHTYGWTQGARMKIDAQTVGDELEKLREEHDGVIVPLDVIEAARGGASPIHAAFTWDDGVAAHLHRLNEARYMIRSLVVVYKKDDDEKRVRAYPNVTVQKVAPDYDGNNGNGAHTFALGVPIEDDSAPHEDARRVYVHIADAMRDKLLRGSIVEGAQREIAAWRRRYAEYDEFASIFETIDNLRLQPRLELEAA